MSTELTEYANRIFSGRNDPPVASRRFDVKLIGWKIEKSENLIAFPGRDEINGPGKGTRVRARTTPTRKSCRFARRKINRVPRFVIFRRVRLGRVGYHRGPLPRLVTDARVPCDRPIIISGTPRLNELEGTRAHGASCRSFLASWRGVLMRFDLLPRNSQPSSREKI